MRSERVGATVRALRRRRGWRQVDLAGQAGVGQSTVSDIERGRIGTVSLDLLRRVLGALDAMVVVEVYWRGGELDRLLDERHASLSGTCAGRLRALGWEVRVEVSYARSGERGSIDILAWHHASATLLVVEVKTELTSAEATLRRLDQKTRLAAIVARERFGWGAARVGVVLTIQEGSTDRRRVERHEALFGAALPARGTTVRRWMADPHGPIRGIWFLSPTGDSGTKRRSSAVARVRVPHPRAVERGDSAAPAWPGARTDAGPT